MNLASVLRQRITIEKPVELQDSAGGFYRSWEEAAVVSASIKAIIDNKTVGGESFESGKIVASSFYRVIIRYRDDITTKMRVLYRGSIFDIRKVINHEERNVYLVLIIEEKK